MKNLLLLLLVSIPVTARSQAVTRPEILVLGTYHMDNPGHDLHNIHADDVLLPERQQEITQLVEVLKRFHPTRIAVESNVGSSRVAKQYADYLAGNYTLSRNEVDQIGYRLARELGHRTVYAVDEDGDFPYERLLNYVKANGMTARLDSISAGTTERVDAEDKFLHSHTILQMLDYLNSDSTVARDVAWYLGVVRFGDPYEYAGPDLVASWYQRNIRIYHNIFSLIDSPSDRVLVIYGAGHLGWLRQDIANDASVTLRKLSDFTTEH